MNSLIALGPGSSLGQGSLLGQADAGAVVAVSNRDRRSRTESTVGAASIESHSVRWKIVSLCAVLIGGCFLMTEHSLHVSHEDDFSLSAETMQSEADGGNSLRRIAFLSLAVCGLIAGVSARDQGSMTVPAREEGDSGSRSSTQDSAVRTTSSAAGLFLKLLLGLTASWAILSVCWSHDPSFTIRRLIVLLCSLTAAWGFSRALRPAELVLLAVLFCSATLGFGLVVELQQGTFRPWSGGYRFAGTLHPNTQGLYLNALCLGAFVLLRTATRIDWRLIVLLGIGLTFLVLTKSRTSTAGVIAGLALLTLLHNRISSGPVLAGLFCLWGGLCVLLIAALADLNPWAEFKSILLMGRTEQAESLTGRLPIWQEVWKYICERPLCGYGYDSFWTPEHIDRISNEVEWGVREAHSSYLEVWLNLGLIGLFLLVGLLCSSVVIAGWRYRSQHNPAAGLLCALGAYGLLNSFTESGLVMPLFVPFLMGMALFQLAGTKSSSHSPTTSLLPAHGAAS